MNVCFSRNDWRRICQETFVLNKERKEAKALDVVDSGTLSLFRIFRTELRSYGTAPFFVAYPTCPNIFLSHIQVVRRSSNRKKNVCTTPTAPHAVSGLKHIVVVLENIHISTQAKDQNWHCELLR